MLASATFSLFLAEPATASCALFSRPERNGAEYIPAKLSEVPLHPIRL